MVWEGLFISSVYPKAVVTGKTKVQKVHIGSPAWPKFSYTTTATVSYTGVYRYGQSQDTEVTITGNEIKVKLGPYQVIDFKVNDFDQTIIKGGYESRDPFDQGVFYLYTEGQVPVEHGYCVVQ